jgi:hypothetical protein
MIKGGREDHILTRGPALYQYKFECFGSMPALIPIANASCGELHQSVGGHYLQVAKVAIPADAPHVDEAESFDRLVFVGIARCVVPTRDGVGTQLDQPEGSRRTGECLSLPELSIGAGTDEGIDR